MGSTVTWFHRTIEQYVAEVTRAGFRLTALSECEPVASRFDGDVAELERRRRVPLFLLLAATQNGNQCDARPHQQPRRAMDPL